MTIPISSDLKADLQASQSGIDYQALKDLQHSMDSATIEEFWKHLLRCLVDHPSEKLHHERLRDVHRLAGPCPPRISTLILRALREDDRTKFRAIERKKLKNSPQATERLCVKEQEQKPQA